MTVKKCPNLKRNVEECPCEHSDCPRRGFCCDCLRYHHASGEPTACEKKAGLVAPAPAPAPESAVTAAGEAKALRLMDYASCAG